MKVVISLIVLSCFFVGAARARTVRATELNSSFWSRLTAGTAEELIVEFRQGDELPVSLAAEGDLLETSRAAVSYVSVKRNFWLKLVNNDVSMSLDGVAYKPIKEMLTGSLTAGASAGDNGGPANAINVVLKASLR